MGTNASNIYDLFMMRITDYRLISLFETSEEDFTTFLGAWLSFAILEFAPVCDQSLTFDTATNTFSVTLSSENIGVLATLMEKYWMNKNVQDITQQNLHITDRDFKVASEAQNLKEKMSALNILKEQCSQLLIDYSYKRTDWSSWYNQSFAGV